MIITHEKYIKECFRLAKLGLGYASPNPLVGAVIVKDDKIISTGFHEKYGSPHAEANAINNAINNAKESLEGATLYCNLEPCSHTDKQTPPCAPLIAKSGIKKVIISNLDPNPKVSSNGVRILRDAGVEVITGIRESEGTELNKFFFKYITQHIPYVTIKIAQSIDGIIAVNNSETTITGEESRNFVHSLRSKYDAILVGANTIKIDNPQLNVRSVKGRNPIRIILDKNFSIPHDSYVITSAAEQPTWIYLAPTSDSENLSQQNNIPSRSESSGPSSPDESDNTTISHSPSPFPPEVKIIQGENDIHSILKNLGREKITSLLVEGGSNIFSQFIDSEMYDELILLIAPKILSAGLPSFISQKTQKLKLISSDRLDEDIKLVYRKL